MTERLLLDEHYSEDIAVALRRRGHDVVSVVADDSLRAASDPIVFTAAAAQGRRIVTENIRDFRPLLLAALAKEDSHAALLLVSPRRFARGSGARTHALVGALAAWLDRASAEHRPVDDWLV